MNESGSCDNQSGAFPRTPAGDTKHHLCVGGSSPFYILFPILLTSMNRALNRTLYNNVVKFLKSIPLRYFSENTTTDSNPLGWKEGGYHSQSFPTWHAAGPGWGARADFPSLKPCHPKVSMAQQHGCHRESRLGPAASKSAFSQDDLNTHGGSRAARAGSAERPPSRCGLTASAPARLLLAPAAPGLPAARWRSNPTSSCNVKRWRGLGEDVIL